MLVIAAEFNPAGAISLIIGLIGLSGIIFTALRFRRDDTTAIVDQQSTITSEFKALNDELRVTADALRKERDELKEQDRRSAGASGYIAHRTTRGSGADQWEDEPTRKEAR